MRPSPRLLVLAAAALLLVGCTPAAPAPEPMPSSAVAVDPTPDPDEVEAAVRDLHERYLVVMTAIARGEYDELAVEGVMIGQAVDSAAAYRDHVSANPGLFEGQIESSGLRVTKADFDGGVHIDFTACENWSSVVITLPGGHPYTPMQAPHIAINRLSATGTSIDVLRIAAEESAAAGVGC